MIHVVDAHLLVFCDSETNALIGAEIWSEEPWAQRHILSASAYVALQAKGADFWEATTRILYDLSDPMYHKRYPVYPRLVELLKEGSRGKCYRTFYNSDEYLAYHAKRLKNYGIT